MRQRHIFLILNGKDDCQTLGKDDIFEVFKTYDAAAKRALECAREEPGTSFFVCQAVAEIACAVGAPETRLIKGAPSPDTEAA